MLNIYFAGGDGARGGTWRVYARGVEVGAQKKKYPKTKKFVHY